jgi:putative phosphonate metabolism protein
MTSLARYAIYFAPARDSSWWRFGASWLGRDETSGAKLPQPELPGCSRSRFEELTTEPRRYGFHATLKAPFSLAQGVDEAHLLHATAALATTAHQVSVGPLSVDHWKGFVALRPVAPPPALVTLAERCAIELDWMRAHLSEAERIRRQTGGLSPREDELLHRYGYPYLLDRYRFHFTLSGRCPPAEAAPLCAAAASACETLAATTPLVVDRLVVFVEPSPGADFRRLAEFELSM